MRESNQLTDREGLIRALVEGIKAFQDAVGRFDGLVATSLGVNDTDLRCLAMLRDRGPLQPSQLASAIGLSRSATTTALGRLEKARFVDRRPNQNDGRSYYVALTSFAADRLEKLWQPIHEQGRQHLERYSNKQLALLATFMVRSKALHDGVSANMISVVDKRPQAAMDMSTTDL